MLPRGLDLVVATPDDDARMIPQTLDVIRGLRADVVKKGLIARIHAAREHELLPQKDAHLVAQLVEVVRLVDASTPHAQHVHVCVARRLDELTVSLPRHARRETVSRNPVRAFCENWNAVDYEREALARRVGLLPQLDRAKADACRRLVRLTASDEQSRANVVERGLAHSVRPPEARPVNREVDGD